MENLQRHRVELSGSIVGVFPYRLGIGLVKKNVEVPQQDSEADSSNENLRVQSGVDDTNALASIPTPWPQENVEGINL
ncbi:hypothetical protein RHSIM_Rhsim04G0138400 [Rhododendron simsii]|uniref:Uncharacterized protein n=1 Tax=Rhododendron simsii TaxID=118357 RepID=A0A834H1R1_RHOSS|nr:hypothetical protein RHSIM_Rhsim04G0138400 [Rhododendron simsii]